MVRKEKEADEECHNEVSMRRKTGPEEVREGRNGKKMNLYKRKRNVWGERGTRGDEKTQGIYEGIMRRTKREKKEMILK